ncbi:MAG: hypothetical protein OXR62_04695 [Ahrensia sp.]|nr:hypothetical protein [Ahrensia sp.]
MKAWVTLIFALAIATLALQKPAQARTLPLSITVSFEDYEFIDDFPGGQDALKQEIREKFLPYFFKRLRHVWSFSDAAAENELLIHVEGSEYEGSPYVEFRFNEGDHDVLEHNSDLNVGFPADGATFAKKLNTALKRAMRENIDEMRVISDGILARWDFGDVTKLRIERSLDQDQRKVYSQRRAELQLGESRPGQVEADPSGMIEHGLFLGPGDIINGALRPIRFDAIRTDTAPIARFCLRRREWDDAVPREARVGYQCPLDGDCASQIVAPEGWAVTQCEDQRGLLDRLPFDFVSPAYANEPTVEHWSVPPLSILYDPAGADIAANTGFTDFTIESDGPLKVEADAVAMELSNNGVPIWINSVPPQDDRFPIDPEDGLLIRFGIQNLQLANRLDGCEQLTARLVFYANGEPTGDAVSLQRLYAPLRHPAERVIETQAGSVLWRGRYRQPAGPNEQGVFIASALFHPDKQGQRERALERLNAIAASLEDANLMMSARAIGGSLGLVGKPDIEANANEPLLQIVGKIRPPRTVRANGSIAYGLQLGLRSPTGLLQFTYDRQQVKNLLGHVRKARRSNGDLAGVLPPPTDYFVYSYTEKRQVGPEWACRAGASAG